VTDGSLHRDTAVEINTSPANGDLLLNQLSDLGEAIRNNGGSCYSDAGMHCHIDARDFRWYDMRRLIFLYEKIELALYSIVPQWRRGNSYCSPCGKYLADALRKTGAVPKESKKGIIGALYGEGFTGDDAEPTEVLTDRYRHGKAQKGMSDRYRGLNLDSWVYRGTVECRIHQGSTRPERMQAWAMMWAAILDYAMKTPEREIIALSGTPLDILRSVPMPSLSLEYINDRTSRFGVAKNFRFPEPPEDSGEDEEPADSYEEPEEPEPPENESLRDYAARTGCNCGVCNEARQQANQQRERGF
jgi:hypothetical protein